MYDSATFLNLMTIFYYFASNRKRIKPKKILIVDDDRNMRHSLLKIMKSENYKALTASNGKVAIKKIKTDSAIKLVLLDQNMPGISGLETLKHIKRYRKDVNVIIITGLVIDEVIKKALELGATGVYRKPFDLNELKATVNNLMKSQ